MMVGGDVIWTIYIWILLLHLSVYLLVGKESSSGGRDVRPVVPVCGQGGTKCGDRGIRSLDSEGSHR